MSTHKIWIATAGIWLLYLRVDHVWFDENSHCIISRRTLLCHSANSVSCCLQTWACCVFQSLEGYYSRMATDADWLGLLSRTLLFWSNQIQPKKNQAGSLAQCILETSKLTLIQTQGKQIPQLETKYNQASDSIASMLGSQAHIGLSLSPMTVRQAAGQWQHW